MSIGPSPSLGGGLSTQNNPTHCIMMCDSKYLPQCSNDCMEQSPCSNKGTGGGGSCRIVDGNGYPPIIRALGLPPLPPLEGVPCSCETGNCPDPVPGPGAPFSQVVMPVHNSHGIGGLQITCAETGATLTSDCAVMPTFFHNSGGVKNYSTPGGPGIDCSAGSVTATSGSGSGTPPATVPIFVNTI